MWNVERSTHVEWRCSSIYKIKKKKEGEHSIPNSCFTWRNTNLRCDYASEMPTGITVFSKNKYIQKLIWLRGNSWYLEKWIWNLNCVIKVVMDSVLLNHSVKDWKKHKHKSLYKWIKCLRKEKKKAIVTTGHGKTDWFKIEKGVCQVYILLPCLFNLHKVHHGKCQAGWIPSWNQVCQKKYQ